MLTSVMINRKQWSRGLGRGFGSLFKPRYEYGPTYYENIQFGEDVKLARKRNADLYKERQAQIDLDAVSRYGVTRKVRGAGVRIDGQAGHGAADWSREDVHARRSELEEAPKVPGGPFAADAEFDTAEGTRPGEQTAHHGGASDRLGQLVQTRQPGRAVVD